MTHTGTYLQEVIAIAAELAPEPVEDLAQALRQVRGRIYCLGIGGSAANCSHMAADFRKLCDLDAVALDSVAELTARANDEGLDTMFVGQLRKLGSDDAIFVLSVGGGTTLVSHAISQAVRLAKEVGAKVFGIVGPVGGDTADLGDCVIRVPAPKGRVTPHTESFQAVLWHCLVSHPKLQQRATTW